MGETSSARVTSARGTVTIVEAEESCAPCDWIRIDASAMQTWAPAVLIGRFKNEQWCFPRS